MARFQLEVGWVQKTMRCWNLVRHARTHEWRTYLHESIFTNKHPSSSITISDPRLATQLWPLLFRFLRCPVRGGLVSYPSSCWDNAHPRALSFGARMCLGLNGWKRWWYVGTSVSKDSDNEWLRCLDQNRDWAQIGETNSLKRHIYFKLGPLSLCFLFNSIPLKPCSRLADWCCVLSLPSPMAWR